MLILGVPQKVIEKKPVRNNNVAFQSGADREKVVYLCNLPGSRVARALYTCSQWAYQRGI